jgi:hypothetical protein
MIFVVRVSGDQDGRRPDDPGIRIALVRRTPSIVADAEGQIDLFCVGDDEAPARLQQDGWSVVMLRDGWYADDTGGGVAIWGQGAFWEIRDTPFSVKEAVGRAPAAAGEGDSGEALDVRRGIFGV